jgi:hypothetical protein
VDEFVRDINKAYQKICADPEMRSQIANIGDYNIHHEFTDHDCWITETVQKGCISSHVGRIGKASVVKHSTLQDYVDLVSGAQSPGDLLNQKKISFEGDHVQLMLFEPILEPLANAFRRI